MNSTHCLVQIENNIISGPSQFLQQIPCTDGKNKVGGLFYPCYMETAAELHAICWGTKILVKLFFSPFFI